MNPKVYSVKRLIGDIRALLTEQYGEIWVEGEIGNLAAPASGHRYFTLANSGGGGRDADAVIRCVLFSRDRLRLATQPSEGMRALLRARVTLYEARGDLQLIVSYLEDAGEGALRRAFEQLKRQLASEGLFDEHRKRELPQYPRSIGVITSISGAALHDIRVTLRRRYPLARLVVYPSQVQGDAAADNIAEMLRIANARGETQALIVARGGGSLEDLQAFNTEAVARAIAASKLPVVSAVGHETDFTIADFAADARAPTPTAAAQLVAPDADELRGAFAHHAGALQRAMTHHIDRRRQRADHAVARLSHPLRRIQLARQTQLAAARALRHHAQAALDRARMQLRERRGALRYLAPQARASHLRRDIVAARARLIAAADARVTSSRRAVETLAAQVRVMSPLHTLERGYAILRNDQHEVIADAARARRGEVLTARLARGELECVVELVREE